MLQHSPVFTSVVIIVNFCPVIFKMRTECLELMKEWRNSIPDEYYLFSSTSLRPANYCYWNRRRN